VVAIFQELPNRTEPHCISG